MNMRIWVNASIPSDIFVDVLLHGDNLTISTNRSHSEHWNGTNLTRHIVYPSVSTSMGDFVRGDRMLDWVSNIRTGEHVEWFGNLQSWIGHVYAESEFCVYDKTKQWWWRRHFGRIIMGHLRVINLDTASNSLSLSQPVYLFIIDREPNVNNNHIGCVSMPNDASGHPLQYSIEDNLSDNNSQITVNETNGIAKISTPNIIFSHRTWCTNWRHESYPVYTTVRVHLICHYKSDLWCGRYMGYTIRHSCG